MNTRVNFALIMVAANGINGQFFNDKDERESTQDKAVSVILSAVTWYSLYRLVKG